jgi:hypothetical protein
VSLSKSGAPETGSAVGDIDEENGVVSWNQIGCDGEVDVCAPGVPVVCVCVCVCVCVLCVCVCVCVYVCVWASVSA